MRRRRALHASRGHAGQGGFTLIEALISLAILALIGSVMGVVFTVGLRTILAPGASDSRLAASSDIMLIQQLLSQDTERASCVVTPGSGSLGACNSVASRCTAADLVCFGWPQIAASSPYAVTCHVAAYSTTAAALTRREWAGGSPLGTQTVGTSREPVRVTAHASSSPATSWSDVQLQVSITSPDVTGNPPAVSFTLTPLATQPTGSAAGITTGTAPC